MTNTRGILAFLIIFPVVLFCAVLAGVSASGPKLVSAKEIVPQAGPRPESTDPKVLQGWELFNAKGCVYCHGPNGEGGVDNNNSQGGKIPSLKKVCEGYSEGELKTKILEGVKESGKQEAQGPVPPLYMPSWKGQLAKDELDAIAKFLFSFPECAKKEEW